MKEENKTAAVMAGVFLILYVLPFVIFLPMNLREGAVGLRDWPVLCHLLLPAAAGVLMILRKPKIAAVLMSLLAIMTIIGAVPQLREFLETGQYCATYDETTGHAEYIPMRFIVLPVLSIATSVFFAVMLYTRGRISLLLAVLIAAGEAAHTVCEFSAMSYVTGHPTPFNLMLPFNYIASALCAGSYLLSLGRGGKE
jgi:hypothetical protein